MTTNVKMTRNGTYEVETVADDGTTIARGTAESYECVSYLTNECDGEGIVGCPYPEECEPVATKRLI